MSAKTSLGAFRAVLRAGSYTFREDAVAYKDFIQQTKGLFLKNKFANENESQPLINDAYEAAYFIRHGIVQAKKDEGKEDYRVKLDKTQVLEHIDKEISLKQIDDRFIKRMEKKVAAEQKGKEENKEENKEQ
ncbi:MZM1 [Acrasis kona]|uniref:MZM1 n=1 Tax=Acrasis kona TaxID=1008807 RepID=A0AAW2YT98_9EUKA